MFHHLIGLEPWITWVAEATKHIDTKNDKAIPVTDREAHRVVRRRGSHIF
jgi:hypothetical protein